MQGPASFGIACRMLIDSIIPGEPERMKRMLVQMRAASNSDTDVQLRAWKVSDTKAVFKLIHMGTGKMILDNSEFEWE